MSSKQKNALVRNVSALALFLLGLFTPWSKPAEMIYFLGIYLFIGWDILWRALRNILRGKIFDENFLMAVATIGAVVLGDYKEAVTVMLFYQVGEWFQKYAVGRSRRSIADLMDIRPDHANKQMADGSYNEVSPEEVLPGEVILVKVGERVPLDGVVLQGASSMDTSALTGESTPRDVQEDSQVHSGCINLSGVLLVRVTKPYGESTVAKILELVENSSGKKAKSENFITRFARYYTPIVCALALAVAVLPPLVTGSAFGPWVYRALTFLVISCPCALVISVPMSFFGGLGGASKLCVLVKGSNYLEILANTDTVVFDKTGTLTKGRFAVSAVEPVGITKQQLLEYAAYAESHSTHPIAQSIRAAYDGPLDVSRVAAVHEVPGYGVEAQIDGRKVLAGNSRMMEQAGITCSSGGDAGTVVHIAVDGAYGGCLSIEDQLKDDAGYAIRQLKNAGIRRTVMLTGDNDAAGRKAAAALAMDEVYTQLLPADKVEKVEQLLREEGPAGKLAFVGDGINDAPVLARADVGIAMGALGSDAAIEAADVVIMTDEPSKIPLAIRQSRRTLRIVKQNIVFALGIKILFLLLGVFGLVTMWAAVFADVGVSTLAILNAMRALNVKKMMQAENEYKSSGKDDSTRGAMAGNRSKALS